MEPWGRDLAGRIEEHRVRSAALASNPSLVEPYLAKLGTSDTQPFTALNGGPLFKLTEAVSFQVECLTQEEVDYYWEKLGAGGAPESQQCGWLKDKFGVSWQVEFLGGDWRMLVAPCLQDRQHALASRTL